MRTSAMIFRREWLEQIGGFDKELKQSHDVDLILRLSLAGCQTIWLKEETVAYRQHESNTTRNSLKQATYVQAVLNKFFARDDLPKSICSQERSIRYHTLVWIAWYQYDGGDLYETIKFLEKSVPLSPYLRAENISHWLTSFKRFSEERGKIFDINVLINCQQWHKLVSKTLKLNVSVSESLKVKHSPNKLTQENESSHIQELASKTIKNQIAKPVKQSLPKDSEIQSYPKPNVQKYQKAKLDRFPPDLKLPSFPGEHNDYSFIEKKVETFINSKTKYSLSVSIIVSFYNSNMKLEKILAEIANQTYPQSLIEVIVVSSTGQETKTSVEQYQQFGSLLEVQSAEPQSIQNTGIRKATNNYLILLDGDMVSSPQLVENYMKYFHVSEQATLIGDRQFTTVDSKSQTSNNLRKDDLKVLDSQHKIYAQSNYLKKDRYPFRAFVSSNVAFSRKLIDKIGLFDESFAHWGHRDKEFGYRIYNEGYYFIPIMDALASHQDFPEGRDKQNKLANNKVEDKLFQQKCPVGWYREFQPGEIYEVPKVSIYIPSYNNGKYIKDAVDSVLNQTYTDVEVCIADDGSTDNTLQVLEKNFQDNPKVKWVTQSNGGIGKASNTAVRLCRGMYIGQLDSDDLLKPEAVATLVEYLENKGYGCVYSSCERIDGEGNYIKDEYSYPTFSREKMMITSIAHHFRMFRRRDWMRTNGFNEQLLNAVDYDMFLKLSEICAFHHIEKMLYLRRWHGNNTSFVNENKQSKNTHIVLTYALERMGLADKWEVYAPDPEQPRKVSYRRKQPLKNIFFFPDYRKSNIYQDLLYSHTPENHALYSGDIGDALQAIKEGLGDVLFHLHWTNYILRKAENLEEAEKFKNQFLKKMFEFLLEGGRLIWTIHNIFPHDCPYLQQEIELRNIISAAAHRIHVHSDKSLPEIQSNFNIPLEKVKVVPHGNYVGVYPNKVSRALARNRFGFSEHQTVFLFLGQIRKYKGIEDLIIAFEEVQKQVSDTHLLIAGKALDPIDIEELNVKPELKEKITIIEQYIPNDELQWFFNATDVAVLPYKKILTSGSLLNAMSFGRPVVAPRVGMTEEIVQDGYNGFLYELDNRVSLAKAMMKMAALQPQERRQVIQQSFDSIKDLTWENIAQELVT